MRKLLIIPFLFLFLQVEGQIIRANGFARAQVVAASTNMISNGTFDNGDDWATNNGAAWTIGSGYATYDYNGGNGRLYQEAAQMISATQINTAYTVKFTITKVSGTDGNPSLALVNYNGTVVYVNWTNGVEGNNTFNFTTPADIGDGGLGILFSAGRDWVLTIDNVEMTAD